MQKRNVVLSIVLTFVTCGIYGLYWMARMTKEVQELSGEKKTASGGMAALFTVLSCTLYSYYWFYQIGGSLAEARRQRGLSADSVSNMATMLCFITTDAAIDSGLLQTALSDIVEQSFNMISIDGDMSTNDMAVVLANGAAGNAKITEKNADYELFHQTLQNICQELAKRIASDGEGATKFLTVHDKALKSGASKVFIEDLTKPFLEEYVWPTLKAGAVYEGKYLLGTSFARPIIAKRLVEIAKSEGADAIAHGRFVRYPGKNDSGTLEEQDR